MFVKRLVNKIYHLLRIFFSKYSYGKQGIFAVKFEQIISTWELETQKVMFRARKKTGKRNTQAASGLILPSLVRSPATV
jgi:hypothetical protein